ncbi:MAG: arylsulfatase [Sphingomonadaceae bacterium]
MAQKLESVNQPGSWTALDQPLSLVPEFLKRLAALLSTSAIFAGSVPAIAQEVIPRTEFNEPMKIGRTIDRSTTPRWPKAPEAPIGAPNIFLILTDDIGFGASSTFGGMIPTPTFDALAASGLRYNQFNTTALCSPTRAALLTGRNPHNVGMGNISNLASGYDGYNSVIPEASGMVAEILRQNGYVTSAYGKWHLTPEWEQSISGPFDRWPTGQGFEYYYGFLGGDSDQFSPGLIENTKAISPPMDDPEYFLENDLASNAINWIRAQHSLAPAKPFFLYYATGTAHAPHHAPKEWLTKFRGKFDQGWDALREQIFVRQKALGIIPSDTNLTLRPPTLPAWASLSADQKRVYARYMEAYAAAIAYSDHEIGRIVDSLKESGQLDNTLIIFIQGDNGSSAEGSLQGEFYEQTFFNGFKRDFNYDLKHIDEIGGPTASNNIPAGWGWAMSTPFQYYKQVASHFGGVRNGLVVSWPKRIKRRGEIRSQFLHVTDVVPTVLDAVGVSPPAVLNGVTQKPLDGISFTYTFDHPVAPSRRRTQVFEMLQNLGIYSDGWWAGTTPMAAPWEVLKGQEINLESRKWELYNVSKDFSQSNDLARSNPQKLQEMKALFYKEAERNQIFPIHGASAVEPTRPSLTKGRSKFTFYSGMTRIPENSAPSTIGKSYTITAEVDLPGRGASGVLVTQGGRFGGYAFYLQDGMPTFYYNALLSGKFRIASDIRLARGRHTLVADFMSDSHTPGSGGTLTISVDGNRLAQGRIEETHRGWFSTTEGLDVGEDTLTPVNDDYSIENSEFSGKIRWLTIEIKH